MIIWILLRIRERIGKLISPKKDSFYKSTVYTLITCMLFLLACIYATAQYASAQRPLWYALSLIFAILCGWIFTTQKNIKLSRNTKRTALGVLSVLLLLNLGITIVSGIKRPEGPNIVLIVIDCLRPDHLGYQGYTRETSPFMDELAQYGTVFKRAYTNSPWTKPSVATMFTSLYPNVHNVLNGYSVMPDGVLTLAEILKNNGYKTYFFNGGNKFIEREYKFFQGFDTYIYRPLESYNASDITNDFLSHVPKTQRKKFFAYLHYMDTHPPYTRNKYNYLFTDTKNADFEPGNKNSKFRYIRLMTHTSQITDDTKRYLVSLYDAQIRFVDECIRKIHDKLQSNNLLKNTILIITSDHGEEFWDHNNFEHGHSVYNELLHVPLIITGPGIRRSVISQTVRLIDIAPTILELSNIKAMPDLKLQGISLAPYLKGEKQPPALPVFATGVLYGPERYCIIRDNIKLILNTGKKKKKWNLLGYQSKNKVELYYLDKDQRERTDMADSTDLSALQKDLEAFKNQKPLFQSDEPAGAIDEGVKEKLEALGYIQ
jgi:arylsulfatase A-like enzyme